MHGFISTMLVIRNGLACPVLGSVASVNFRHVSEKITDYFVLINLQKVQIINEKDAIFSQMQHNPHLSISEIKVYTSQIELE